LSNRATKEIVDFVHAPLKVYGFVNARIRSRLSRLLTDENFRTLMEVRGIEEIVAELKHTEYGESLDLYASTGDISAVEYALTVHEINTVRDLLAQLKGSATGFVSALLLRYEVELVKNALRLWFDRVVRGRSTDISVAYLYTGALNQHIDLDGIVNALNEEELLSVLKGSPYQEIVRKNLGVMKTEGHIFSLETELDGFFYQRLFEAIQLLNKKDRRIAERILHVEIDLQNIDRIVRFVSFYGSAARTRFSLFLPGGSIKQETLEEAYRQEGAEEAMSVLLSENYSGYRAFTGEHHSGLYARLSLVEGLLRQILDDEVKRLLYGYPFTIGTVIAYVFLKRREINLLIRMINAKYYGLSEEKLREVL
jgi:V/A-type H+-transporting ATPase subunit C